MRNRGRWQTPQKPRLKSRSSCCREANQDSEGKQAPGFGIELCGVFKENGFKRALIVSLRERTFRLVRTYLFFPSQLVNKIQQYGRWVFALTADTLVLHISMTGSDAARNDSGDGLLPTHGQPRQTSWVSGLVLNPRHCGDLWSKPAKGSSVSNVKKYRNKSLPNIQLHCNCLLSAILSVDGSWLLQILHRSCNSWHSAGQPKLYIWSTSPAADVHWFENQYRKTPKQLHYVRLRNFT